MEKIIGLCMGCMSPMERGVSICNRCSYDNTIPNPRGTLPAGTLLDGRYLVGKQIRRNDLTVTYLGLSTEKNVKVYIEEFFPQPLVSRDWDGCTVSVPEENRIRYKTLFSDMADRWKRLSKLDNRCVMKIRELINDFGTIYCIMAYLPYDTLEQQLEDRGVYSWPEAKAAFMPLFSLVSTLHTQGLTHCGVSPENIIVNRRGELVLMGFALPELRTEGGGLTPELYSGYSAPEQYSKNMWQGEWTDVYSLATVLYRALTGAIPQPALERTRKDLLPEAAAVDPSIPDHVSEALYKAMQPDKQKRFGSVDEFTAALLREATSNTAVFRPDPSAVRTAPAQPAKFNMSGIKIGKFNLGRFKVNVNLVLVVLLVISIFANVILALVNRSPAVVEPSSDSVSVSSEPAQEMMTQKLVGVYIKVIQDNPADYGNLIVKPEYAYNEDFPENIVYDQSVKVGDPMPEDRAVTLYVSKGSRYIIMPYLNGSSANFASKTLTDLNIKFDFEYDYNPDSPGLEGTVTGCNKGFGARIARDEQVVITVKAAPPESVSSE